MMKVRESVYVAGREGIVHGGAKVLIGGCLWLGHGGGPAGDMGNCVQYIDRDELPEGYEGVRRRDGHALFGGSWDFMADEVEVIRVDGRSLRSLKVIEDSTLDPVKSAALYRFLGLTVANIRLKLIYRASRNGPSYADMLRCVGDARGLVFAIKKGG
mmetsp:Transcript_39591/g.112900  ORF Transcript_39591/g.112900 Transcript_39591/m.112900 type:complete len:157 (-) Transcript_39591:657-1127(-)